jgi:DNA helicase HerA-like ATPase
VDDSLPMGGSHVASAGGPQVAKAGLQSARDPGQIGVVTAVSGSRLSFALLNSALVSAGQADYGRMQVGTLVKISTPSTSAFGFIESIAFQRTPTGAAPDSLAIANVELLGEIAEGASDSSRAFLRGISIYPVLAAPVFLASPDDLTFIYAKPKSWTVPIGSLYQNPDRTAHLLLEEFLSRHSAILGTTGTGKSCALALILHALLKQNPNAHVVLLDPHDEYAAAFQGVADCITPRNLQLPYWLLSFEEISELFCSRDPNARSRETPILREAIVRSKNDYTGASGDNPRIAADTPVPYRIMHLLQNISAASGRLNKPDDATPYLRLIARIEWLARDKQYEFMFGGAIADNMGTVLSRLLRIPVSGRPITIFDMSAVPSEVVDIVVSLMCRLIFDFARWASRDRGFPTLLVCEEAHRYLPRDETTGFEPTRRAISRIAKEGRKYGVSLCLVTQHVSEISERVLSQCSTILALRLSNEADQAFIRRALTDNAGGLLSALPALQRQEAIAFGEGVPHPMRIRFADLESALQPKSNTASFHDAWKQDLRDYDFVDDIIERWREQSY